MKDHPGFERPSENDWIEDTGPWLPDDDLEDGDVDVSDDALLSKMIRCKGTDEARELFDLLHPSTWDSRDTSVAILIGKVNALADSGQITADERCYMIHQIIDPLCLDRAEQTGARYVEVRTALDAREREAQARGDLYDYQLEPEFVQLNAEWHLRVEGAEADWWDELGEQGIAREVRHDRRAFRRRLDRGEQSLFGSVETQFDWADHPGS